MTETELVVYTQPSCTYSDELKKWLRQHKIKYTEKDITKDRQAWDELIQRGVRATPLTVYGDKKVAGFQPEEIEKMMGG
jgi:glutaredoxin